MANTLQHSAASTNTTPADHNITATNQQDVHTTSSWEDFKAIHNSDPYAWRSHVWAILGEAVSGVAPLGAKTD